MSHIEWKNLRTWNGSQHSAFEELCCQLARYENVPENSKFIRKGTPDAGVECYWQLPNGDELAWQAKFFTFVPDSNQWKQVDESVKTALEKHNRLVSYTICMPRDREDPRIEEQEWFMDKWNDYVEKWEKWAKGKGMSVDFKYWGSHEICERLSREEHRGRYLFWFNQEFFSHRWFKDRIDVTIANAEPRYTPELNVKLPIAQMFEGLGRTQDFFKQLYLLYGKIKKAYFDMDLRRAEELDRNRFNSLKKGIDIFIAAMEELKETESEFFEFNEISKFVHSLEDTVWEWYGSLEKTIGKIIKEKKENKETWMQLDRSLSRLAQDLTKYTSFTDGYTFLLASLPALLLIGKAGTGKTHILCDIASLRVSKNLPTILLLGAQFKDDEPWSQIIRLLGLSCDKDEFLGALESAAQAKGGRVLIIIDALNEGEGKRLWGKHIAGMLVTLSKYPWIGIAVSVRTSYESLVIPGHLLQEKRLVRVEHPGFEGQENQAVRTFFNYYGIEHPKSPILVPEFHNPLFLKLFCEGLKNKNLTRIPTGLQGITTIFNFFIDSVNQKLSHPEKLDLDLSLKNEGARQIFYAIEIVFYFLYN